MPSFRHKPKVYNKSRLRPKGWLDFSAPGHNYFGPNNPVDDFPPTTEFDSFARPHDAPDYSYDQWQDSDDVLLQQMENAQPADAWEVLGRDYFRFKRKLYDWGVIKKKQKVGFGEITKITNPLTDPETPKNVPAAAPSIEPKAPEAKKSDILKLPTPKTIQDVRRNEKTSDVKEIQAESNKHLISKNPLDPTSAPDMSSKVAPIADSVFGRDAESDIISGLPTHYRPFPTAINVLMPYDMSGETVSIASGTSATAAPYMTFRLNSIYDCRESAAYPAYGDAPLGTSATYSDGVANTPKMRGYWTQYYQYWTVLECKWTVRMRNTSNRPNSEVMAFFYLHGAQWPPQLDQDGNIVDYHYRKRHPGCTVVPLKSRTESYAALTGFDIGTTTTTHYDDTNIYVNDVVQSGVWTPGSIPHEIIEDELMQTWQKVTEVPPTQELLTIIFQNSPRYGTSTSSSVYVEVELEYTVQMRDLKQQYQFVTKYGDHAAVNNFGIQGA